MQSELASIIQKLLVSGALPHLNNSLIGIEKESLRVNSDANIAQTPHPAALGSALTNPYITTDYSEALIEFITPPLNSIDAVLNFMQDLHKFTYQRLDNEYLWATSMPCVVKNESNIPVAQYGSSNQGKMKTIYREGLGHRYGKTMQIIAGIHFNYSYSNEFWSHYQRLKQDTQPQQSFVDSEYFSLIRNLLRLGWVIPYLFGSSPAVCKSFFGATTPNLQSFDDKTYYQPYATSLRMSDIGYQNNEENKNGIKACYDTLDEYVANLKFAIQTPCPEHQKIGVKVDGEYRQLNANILQIENEYYSTVRPKQIAEQNEQPINALNHRGVRYIELRSLDVNAYDPLGINDQQLYFLEALMLYCLLVESPYISVSERTEIDNNEMTVALRGRQPDLQLTRNGQPVRMQSWLYEVFDSLQQVCALLDESKGTSSYTDTLNNLRNLVDNPELTPSALMLSEMRSRNEGFHHFAKRISLQYYDYFKDTSITPERNDFLVEQARLSIVKQQEIEQGDTLGFEAYLQSYFSGAR